MGRQPVARVRDPFGERGAHVARAHISLSRRASDFPPLPSPSAVASRGALDSRVAPATPVAPRLLAHRSPALSVSRDRTSRLASWRSRRWCSGSPAAPARPAPSELERAATWNERSWDRSQLDLLVLSREDAEARVRGARKPSRTSAERVTSVESVGSSSIPRSRRPGTGAVLEIQSPPKRRSPTVRTFGTPSGSAGSTG